jgi:geranylgeranyl diphosphate synthase type II
MITCKTAVLIGCALQTGALLAGCDEEDAGNMYEFGKNLGIAFQLHDDMLDVYGDEKVFGKKSGGDIVANKKTFLLITALKSAGDAERKELKKWIAASSFRPEEKIEFFKNIYRELNVKEKAEAEMEKYFQSALHAFKSVSADLSRKEPLIQLAGQLMVRTK